MKDQIAVVTGGAQGIGLAVATDPVPYAVPQGLHRDSDRDGEQIHSS